MKKSIILILLLAPFGLMAQIHAINGTVTAFNKYPLENVVVKSKKNKTQVVTNQKGEFVIEVVKNDVLLFEAHGFEPYQLKVAKPESVKPIKTNLIYTNKPEDYEVAVAYGHMRKEDLTFAISNLLIENNDYSRYSDIYDLILSKAPGITVAQEGGQRIFIIRGMSSISSSNAALLVVDGVVVNSLDGINVYDIASIQVLKDGSAAMYGSRGGNGVIMVNTKRGGE